MSNFTKDMIWIIAPAYGAMCIAALLVGWHGVVILAAWGM